uniref:Uncharacterized protein n=1 Tax=Timema tahoe TaxID=61484 RepID=A0A7R9FKM0_9NEOP|nr:unnamed protein product [Timema tahoe]
MFEQALGYKKYKEYKEYKKSPNGSYLENNILQVFKVLCMLLSFNAALLPPDLFFKNSVELGQLGQVLLRLTEQSRQVSDAAF